MSGGVLRGRDLPGRGFVGAGASIQEPGGPWDLAGSVFLHFNLGPVILASRVLVGFRPAPHTLREEAA